jgi:hypothetical protein
MRKYLVSILLAFEIGLAGTASASAMISSGIINKANTNSSPPNSSLRPRQATEQCRVRTVCDDHGNNCQTVDDCR